eukprot:COSAG02_NODE_3257_length_7081_cov_3.996419_4_plen_373_part_00
MSAFHHHVLVLAACTSTHTNVICSMQNKKDLLRDGKKLGVFVDGWRRGIPGLEHRTDRLIRSAPSNELISASYEKMIFERYPEERGSKYQLKMTRRRKLEEDQLRKRKQEEEMKRLERIRQAEMEKKAMKRVKIAGGEWKGEICAVLGEMGDDILVEFEGQRYRISKTGRGGIVITDVEESTGGETTFSTQNNVIDPSLRGPTTQSEHRERVDSANDPFQSLLLPTRHSERLQVHPLLGPLPPEDDNRQTPSRGPTPGGNGPGGTRDRLGFTPSASAGCEISARNEFLEGWVQFGVQSLRSGESLPPLSGENPSRRVGLQAASGRQSVRKVAKSASAIDSFSRQSLATPTARLSFSEVSLDETATQRPRSKA